MERETAIIKLKKILDRNRSNKDAAVFNPGDSHNQADKVLCDLLESLGYRDVVKAYDDIQPKWYE